jgi:site-specific DNA-cytosine methylase
MKLKPVTQEEVITHAHLFCGIGVGAKGFNKATPRVANIVGRYKCIGGIDVDAGAMRNYQKMTGHPGTVLDLFSLEQYRAWNDNDPPPGWKEATPLDIWIAFGRETPDVLFLSAPCKGFSGLLASIHAATDQYQALNGLTLRGIWLTLEAYKDNPIPIILFENVPRIRSRGRKFLDQIIALLRAYGYSVNEDTHDCGVIGGLAQSRKRFLLIARHSAKVPPFVYQPKHHRLRGVGEVIGKLPLPGDPVGGPMHRVPALQWQTWLRLAFVPAGKDWRALSDYRVVDGMLADYGIVPERELRDNQLGVCAWGESAPLITGQRSPQQGKFSVADPRPGYGDSTHRHVLGVNEWEGAPTGAVSGSAKPTTGANAIADPRVEYMHADGLGVHAYDDTTGVLGGRSGPTNGAYAVADPRGKQANQTYQQYGVKGWEDPSVAVSGQSTPGGGPYAVADPSLGRTAHSNVYRVVPFDNTGVAVTSSRDTAVADPRPAPREYSSRKYKVTPMEATSRAVIAASTTGEGAYAVADPRPQWGNQRHRNILRVTPEDQPVGTIPANPHSVTGGQPCVADSRREAFDNGGHYGVQEWDGTSGAVSGHPKHNNGRWNIADPRDVPMAPEFAGLPDPKDRLVCRIIATDNTWHRPFTTLDLASLQALFDPEEAFGCENGVWFARTGFDLDASSDVAKREWIGNAVPGDSATGMAETIGETIILARLGESFMLSTREIWVKPGALALAVDNDQHAFHMDRGE